MPQDTKGIDFCYRFKVVLVGDSGVGKTNLMLRFTKNEYSERTASTIGVEFETRFAKLLDGKFAKLQIWDTAGQERFRAVSSAYYRSAHGALLVYDISRRESFENVPRWMDEIRDYAKPDVVLCLVGNKRDLPPELRQVTTEEGRSMAAELGITFAEVSAKDESQLSLVEDVFFSMSRKIYEAILRERIHKSPSVTECQKLPMRTHDIHEDVSQDEEIWPCC